ENEGATGRSMREFIDARDAAIIQSIDAAIETTGVWRGMLPVARQNGVPVDLEWNVSRHSVPGVRLAIANDVTERNRTAVQVRNLLGSERAARSEAERANRLKDDFL